MPQVLLCQHRRVAALALPLLSSMSCHCGGTTNTDGDPFSSRTPLTHPVIVRPAVQPIQLSSVPIVPAKIRTVPNLPPVLRGPRQVDVYVQDEAIVDVLWIVDNSGSLNNERQRLAEQFDRFLNVLLAADVDFHVGVTSTDLSPTGDGGRLRGLVPWIDRNTPEPVLAFRQALQFPADENITLEEGLAAIPAALTPPNSIGANLGFLREEAAFAAILVSDEDDGSLGPTRYYIRFLQALKGPGRDANISFSAVVGPVPDGCVPPGKEFIFGAKAEAAERYTEVVEASGGLIESICAADFAPFVETLATSLAGLRRFFPLSAPPDSGSIQVFIDGVRITESESDGWAWLSSERAIVFTSQAVPPPGTEVQIAYDVEL